MSCQGRLLSNRAIQQMLQYQLTPFSLLFFFYRSFLCNLFRSNSCLFFLHVIFSPAWTCSNSLLKRHIHCKDVNVLFYCILFLMELMFYFCSERTTERFKQRVWQVWEWFKGSSKCWSGVYFNLFDTMHFEMKCLCSGLNVFLCVILINCLTICMSWSTGMAREKAKQTRS